MKATAVVAAAIFTGAIAGTVALGLSLQVVHGQASAKITPGKAVVETPIPPGSRTPLPALVVRNEGDTPFHARMAAQSDEPGVAGWITFDPAEFTLDGDTAQVVNVWVEVPSDVAVGERRLRLRASTAAPGPGAGGVGLSVAVASVIDFTVGWPSGGSQPTEADLAAQGGAAQGGAAIGPGLVFSSVAVAILSGALTVLIIERRTDVLRWWRDIEFQSPVRRKRK